MSCSLIQPCSTVPPLAAQDPLPSNFQGFRGYHSGETFVVCGCGVSLKTLVNPERFITIGVNDVGRMFAPDYLVVVNPRNQFQSDRFRYVEQSAARAIFTQLNLGLKHPHVVRFTLGARGGVDFSNPNVLHYTNNSPYVALCLAVHMGARKIGLIGVDFTSNHFFAQTGLHPLERQLLQIDREYKRLYDACLRAGVEVFNLSAESRLTALPKLSLSEFAGQQKAPQSLRIVSYATTPVAGVPVILSRSIAARTHHACRTVWASNSYGNGVAFESDVEWQRAPSEADNLLRSADVVIAHNGKIDPRHQSLLTGKPVITMAHNYMWNVDSAFVQRGFPGVVVGQYQATLPEFKEWQPVPNPVPLWEPDFTSGPKPSQITIGYTPSGKHESYPIGHRLYWHSKGYATTMKVLERLARHFPINLEVIHGNQVTHSESLAMKRRSHIVIDECVTGSYHRNSLEGLASGCVVVNGVGRLPAVAEVFRHCAGTSDIPFVSAGLENLEEVLTALIERGPEALAAEGARNRAWMKEHWNFERQWARFWQPVVAQALEQSGHKKPPPIISRVAPPNSESSMNSQIKTREWKEGLSVVICHGGQDRLPQLAASLASLRQCSGPNEIIVVDMGSQPFAENVARRWADKYIFIRNDNVFERARALNIGTGLAEYDLVLWMDNDLVIPPDFIAKAIAEMRSRQLDYLIPYSRIHYLSASDTQAVMRGIRNPLDCPVVGVLLPVRGACGAAGLVKRSFVLAYGGMSEDFRGWGGEDDAWWHKAKLLGRAAATQRHDQCLHHLFHPNSGAYGGSQHRTNNPHYATNLAVLNEMRSVHDPKTFIKRYQPRTRLSCGWEDKQVTLIARSPTEGLDCSVDEIARALSELVEVKVACRITGNNGHACQELASGAASDSTVVFGTALAASFLSSDSLQPHWPKTIAVPTGDFPNGELLQRLQHTGAVLCMSSFGAAAVKQAGMRPWNGIEKGPPTPTRIALALLQPLSIILGGAPSSNIAKLPDSKPGALEKAAERSDSDGRISLPVWMYWEGDSPEWIKQCQQTVFAHAEDVRLLSAGDFDRLRDSDRDIDLKKLHVAQRADYIRAFLLARYGGLWIDSDCIVVQSLGPLLDALGQYDFMAHRERTAGLLANDLMGAPPGSRIASALYQKICATLRSHRPVGWTSLGCVPVTEVLTATTAPWFEIKSARIQPVCWSTPDPFLRMSDPAEHEQNFDRRALCYMLSNLTMQKKFQTADLSAALLAKGTFFNYLIGKSLQNGGSMAETPGASRSKSKSKPKSKSESVEVVAQSLGASQPMTDVFTRIMSACSKAGYESLSGPGSSLANTAEIRQRLPLVLQELGVRSLLDAACGDFHWMKHITLGIEEYIGADIIPSVVEQDQKNFSGSDRTFLALDITRDLLPKADLILCRDCLVHFSHEDIFRALKNFKSSKSKYLLTTTFETTQVNSDIATGGWRPINFRAAPFNFPEPILMVNEKCKENDGRYSDKSLALWSIADLPIDDLSLQEVAKASGPKSKSKRVRTPAESFSDLGASQPIADVFTRMMSACSRAGYESLSGPGSSLASTAEIRQRLPLVLQELGVRSLLDAPCGDFHWMKHVALGIEEYIGADVIPSVVEQNQKNFSAPGRTFIALDITRDSVPKVDLILCRDCLVHFSYENIFRALKNFKSSKSKYLLTTTFVNVQLNTDIATGDWRPLNFRLAPFNFPDPIFILNEKCRENGGRYADKSLALWKLKDLL